MDRSVALTIVGCGAAAVCFLRSLIQFSKNIQRLNVNITIYDPSNSFGVGLAYQDDLQNLIVNRPMQTMAAHAFQLEEFLNWFKNRQDLKYHEIVEGENEKDQRSYIPRNVFGLYLNDTLDKLLQKGKKEGIDIQLIKKEVIEISGKNDFLITLNSNEKHKADFIVLCTGNNTPKNIYNLSHEKRYINNPYPISTKLKNLNNLRNVGIIGSSLTAIDIAISLKKLGHKGKIFMLSRTCVYPRVRGKIVPYKLKYFNFLNIKKIAEKKGATSLRDVLRLLRMELKEVDFNWKILFKENTQQENFVNFIQSELQAASGERRWQSVLCATNEVIDICWQHLDNHSKNLFLEKYHRLWLTNRSPIPMVNAKFLLELFKEGQLSFYSPLLSIQYIEEENNFLAKYCESKNLIIDQVINATGPSKYINTEDTLMMQLVKNELLRENQYGGVDVDFESSSAINGKGEINPYMRLLGHNTSGVYFYTNSLEMIAKRSRKVAENLINFICKDFSYG